VRCHRQAADTFLSEEPRKVTEGFVKVRKLLAGALTGLALAGGAIAMPHASATAAYFSITGTGLAVSDPAPSGGRNLGDVASGSLSVLGTLGNVTVTDGRAAPLALAVWTATATATDFVRDGAAATPAANEKVATTNIAYSSGASSAATGGVFTPGVIASMAAASTARIAGTFAGIGGNNTATWDPTLTFTLLSSQVAGTYRGTVTHSVA
jgi:hypothetical protein